MFGLGAGELLVLLVVALLFLGPEKLPDAAKSISKGIRDFRRHTRDLQETLEEDTQIGDAYRDLRSALRGDELRTRKSPPPPRKPLDGDQPPALKGGDAPAAPAGTLTGAAASTDRATPEPSAAAEPASTAGDDSDDGEMPVVRPAAGAVPRSASGIAPEEPAASPDHDEDPGQTPERDQKAHG
jgi:sec-independent protein translocase protein TatB